MPDSLVVRLHDLVVGRLTRGSDPSRVRLDVDAGFDSGQITLTENRFGFEPEITAKVARLKCRIYEVAVSYSGRTYAEGKKIGWQDGFSALRCIVRYNLLP